MGVVSISGIGDAELGSAATALTVSNVDRKTGRQGGRETGRQGTGKQGDREAGRQGGRKQNDRKKATENL